MFVIRTWARQQSSVQLHSYLTSFPGVTTSTPHTNELGQVEMTACGVVLDHHLPTFRRLAAEPYARLRHIVKVSRVFTHSKQGPTDTYVLHDQTHGKHPAPTVLHSARR